MSDRFQEFIDALYKAGWNAPNDAQHSNIVGVFSEFCDQGRRIESLTKQLQSKQQRLTRLEGLLRRAKLNVKCDSPLDIEIQHALVEPRGSKEE